jgi:predicted RNase H-like nuclease
MIAGIDGCKKGWIVAIEDAAGGISVELFAEFTEILSRDELRFVVIDIPIGLTEIGARNADMEARKLLQKRSCCVFPAPIRAMLDSRSQQEASERRRSVEGKGVSAQLWGILPKIKEVDSVMSTNVTLQRRVREGHPEVSFAMMNGGFPVTVRKAKAEGQRQRRELLAKHFAGAEQCLARLHTSLRIDAVDAFSMLWTARRVAAGTEVRFPERAEPDRFGLYPRIVA